MRKRFALLVLTIATTLAALGFLGYNTFKVNDVKVQGTVYTSAEDVLHLAGISLGESIFRVDLDACRRNIEQNPYYDVLAITRAYPDKLSIIVRERQVRAGIHWLGAMLVMDEEGVILELTSTPGDMHYPIVSGMDVANYRVGERIASNKASQVPAMEAVLQALIEQDATNLISEINVADLSDQYMITTTGIKVRLGDAKGIRKQVQWLRGVLPELMNMGFTSGTLDVRSPEKAADFLPTTAATPVPALPPPADIPPPTPTPAPTTLRATPSPATSSAATRTPARTGTR